MDLGGDTKAVLLAAGLIFIGALVLGAWKYRQMTASPDGQAHPYVDVAHRAALLYSFATLLIASFVDLEAPRRLDLGVRIAGAVGPDRRRPRDQHPVTDLQRSAESDLSLERRPGRDSLAR